MTVIFQLKKAESIWLLIATFFAVSILLLINFRSIVDSTSTKFDQATHQEDTGSEPASDENPSQSSDNEEDEDDSDDKINHSPLALARIITFNRSKIFYQDQLFSDQHSELDSPPPKA